MPDVTDAIHHDRRRFLRTGALTIAAARFGIFGRAQANQRVPREVAAIANAPEWLNSPRLTASSLAGKVVLVDFWTYTCINWLRTLPYVRAWAQKYQPGLVVIGVHTPEFPFEHNVDNVRRAVQQMRIEYPIVIDNDYAIWRAFDNQYWPALYMVDGRGRVRQRQFGEGEYETSERAIQRLLKEAGMSGVSDGVVSVAGSGFEAAADWRSLRSPETYLGYDRSPNFASRDAARLVTYTWLICYKKYPDRNKLRAMQDLVKYGLTEGQKDAEALGYIPLPAAVVAKATIALENLEAE